MGRPVLESYLTQYRQYRHAKLESAGLLDLQEKFELKGQWQSGKVNKTFVNVRITDERTLPLCHFVIQIFKTSGALAPYRGRNLLRHQMPIQLTKDLRIISGNN
jgi:hypothetical protein